MVSHANSASPQTSPLVSAAICGRGRFLDIYDEQFRRTTPDLAGRIGHRCNCRVIQLKRLCVCPFLLRSRAPNSEGFIRTHTPGRHPCQGLQPGAATSCRATTGLCYCSRSGWTVGLVGLVWDVACNVPPIPRPHNHARPCTRVQRQERTARSIYHRITRVALLSTLHVTEAYYSADTHRSMVSRTKTEWGGSL